MGPRHERGGAGRRPGLPARRPGPGRPEPVGGSEGSAEAPEARRPGDEASLRRLTAASPRRKAPTLVVTGVLERLDIETRPLVLVADDGARWELLLPPGWTLDADAGARVTVAGEPAPDVRTTTMAGPVLRVRSLSRAT